MLRAPGFAAKTTFELEYDLQRHETQVHDKKIELESGAKTSNLPEYIKFDMCDGISSGPNGRIYCETAGLKLSTGMHHIRII